ncbi:MAG: IMP dehydrogenase [Ardenticatenaceae bacterium]|nr:IMP dehydrogenase [Ardenticatenaceae bacterium]MCB8987009.1 IMP dehydrogenase [Ardenticatenaceae bacterium]
MEISEKVTGLALTFDDVLLVPGFSSILPAEVSLRTRLVRDIYLNVPVLSAAMDTVSEAKMGIGLARLGGLAVIHRNLSPEEQAAEVDKVKRSEAGMIVDPITLKADNTLADAEAIMSRYRISGVPITDDNGRLVGILTNRDVRFVTPGAQKIADYMTSQNLVTAPVGTTLPEAREILHTHRIEKLPLVDGDGRLKGLITVKDILKKIDYPDEVSDANDRLLCAAAIGVGDKGLARLELLVRAGVDVVVIDTAHAHTALVLKTLEEVKRRYPDLPVIGGNAATAVGARDLINAGADAVKVGIGAGSICTTRIVAGAGVPQLTAVLECAAECHKHDIPCIADGGIKYSGDIVKALAAGADAVMLGSMLAGLEESPGEIYMYEGRRYKVYRGMGSLGAMQGFGADRYASGVKKSGERDKLVPEGVEGQVPYRGKLADILYQMMGGLRSGMGYVGAANLEELREKSRFVQITNAGLLESHPHGILITKEAPNYQVRR